MFATPHDLAISAARSQAGNALRVLLAMPPDVARAAQPHLGLGLLATRLRNAGFSVLVADYSFRPDLPPIETILARFEPAIVGVSVFSQSLTNTKRFVRRIGAARPQAVVVLGGPHITISEPSDLEDLRACGATTLVQGEAEDRIVELAQEIVDGRAPAAVRCAPARFTPQAWPDFHLFLGGKDLTTYPQQLSRGCPYQCIFCNVQRIAGRKFRARDVDDAIAEVVDATKRYPRLQFVKITDDAPNTIPERVEEYLARYVSRRLEPRLEIMQLRADNLTEPIARLLKRAGAPYVVVGVESGDEAVFTAVRKGETLDDIRTACRRVREADLPLVMCFVLGLPVSSPERDQTSIRFAREMRPLHCYWNVAQPMPGTEMFQFFKREGRILAANVAEESSLDGGCFADTPAYPALERVRMQVVAQASTNERARNWRYLLSRGARLGVLGRVCRAMTLERPTIPAAAERRW